MTEIETLTKCLPLLECFQMHHLSYIKLKSFRLVSYQKMLLVAFRPKNAR